MFSANLDKVYKVLRILIHLIPVAVIMLVIYAIFFPVEVNKFYSDRPDISKFQFEKNESKSQVVFGFFPIQSHKYIKFKASLEKISQACAANSVEVITEKNYRSFLFPEGIPIERKEELQKLLFRENKTQYPNGSLLHFKPTDEVFLISDGKKILFPGPEIFLAYGYSFDNLVDVNKSVLDLFPYAEKKTFFWHSPHPNGTIFRSLPSGKLYLTLDGEKRLIKNASDLENIWPRFFALTADDPENEKKISCLLDASELKNRKMSCIFDWQKNISALGGYYQFTMNFPSSCQVSDVIFKKASLSLVQEKSFAVFKESLRNIFASILNRYYLKQLQ